MTKITMTEIKSVNTWSLKDDSPRGYRTANNDEIKPGDIVIYNNRFTLVVDDTETETSQERANREKREHCKQIAETLEAYATEGGYICPHCGEFHAFAEYEESEHKNENGETCYTCPDCSEEIEENELEAVTLWDYFNDVFDIEYRIGSDKQFRSVSVMVACGGPNIYIDTQKKAVCLYWWNEFAEYPITYETAEAVNAYFEELYNC